MSLLPPRARGMIWSIDSWVSCLVWPQLWHWYLLRVNTYFLTSGGMGILGVLVMNCSVDFHGLVVGGANRQGVILAR